MVSCIRAPVAGSLLEFRSACSPHRGGHGGNPRKPGATDLATQREARPRSRLRGNFDLLCRKGNKNDFFSAFRSKPSASCEPFPGRLPRLMIAFDVDHEVQPARVNHEADCNTGTPPLRPYGAFHDSTTRCRNAAVHASRRPPGSAPGPKPELPAGGPRPRFPAAHRNVRRASATELLEG